MTAPMTPETGTARLARIRADFARIRAAVDAGEAPPTIVQRYIERERVSPESELAAMPMETREWVGNTMRAAYQGSSLNFGDELMGTVRGVEQTVTQGGRLRENVASGIADERAQLNRFREEAPGVAFATEMAGGLVTGVGAAKALGSVPRLMLANPVKTAAVTGAAAGVGSGESTTGRAVMGTVGAVAGAGLTAGASRLATSRTADRAVRTVRDAMEQVNAPGQPAVATRAAESVEPVPRINPARSAVARVLADETGSMDSARRAVADLEAAGMGEEMLVLNAAGEPGARLARAVANTPSVPFARTSANEVIGDALARQGGVLGREVSADIGTATGLGGTPGPVALRDMQDELSRRTGSTFDAFRARGDLQPERTARLAEAAAKASAAGGPALESARTASGRPVRDLTRVSQEGLLDELTRRTDLERLYQSDLRKYGPSSAVTVRNQEVISTVEDLLEKQHGMAWDDIWAEVAKRQAKGQGPRQEFDAASGMMLEVDDAVPAAAGDAPMPDFFNEVGDGPLSLDPKTGVQFQRFINAVRENPELAALPETDARVIDEAFKLLQEQVRKSRGGKSAVKTRGLVEMRNRVLAGIEAFDPNYSAAVRDYALDDEVGKVVQDSFTQGLRLRTAPVGTFTAETRGAAPQVVEGMRRGAATAYQSAAEEVASNVNLGELAKFRDVARSVVGTEGQAKRFREIFGEQSYDRLLSRLTPKIRAAALNAIVRGNSTTARQLMDALALGNDAVLDVLQAATSGHGGLVSAAVGAAKAPVNAMRAAGLGENATKAAKLLSVRGAGRSRVVLDALERVAKEEAKRKRAVVPAVGAASRSAVDRIR